MSTDTSEGVTQFCPRCVFLDDEIKRLQAQNAYVMERLRRQAVYHSRRYEQALDSFERLQADTEALVEAIDRHFAQLHSVVDYAAIIINDDGDLQTVDEVMEGDWVIVDRRPAAPTEEEQ
jgi:hypothetical protein